jgi:hypothetical protein
VETDSPQFFDKSQSPNTATGDVVADMNGGIGRRFRVVEQVVEGRHPVGLGRWNLEQPAHVVKAAGADPTDSSLEGMQRREQQVAPCNSTAPATQHEAFTDGHGGRTDLGDDRFDRSYLRGGRR